MHPPTGYDACTIRVQLQEAYDSFQACQRNSYSLCRGWTNATQTVRDLIGRTTDLCKVVQGICFVLLDLFTNKS